MNDAEATRFAVEELGKYRTRSEIVEALCWQFNLPWSEADLIVAQVEAQHGGKIARRQAPLVLILGVLSFAAGIGLVGFTLWALISPDAARIRADFGLLEPSAMQTLSNFGPFIQWALHSKEIDELLLLGAGLIAGGTVGLLTGTGKLFRK
jgi:hypothetical protein